MQKKTYEINSSPVGQQYDPDHSHIVACTIPEADILRVFKNKIWKNIYINPC